MKKHVKKTGGTTGTNDPTKFNQPSLPWKAQNLIPPAGNSPGQMLSVKPQQLQQQQFTNLGKIKVNVIPESHVEEKMKTSAVLFKNMVLKEGYIKNKENVQNFNLPKYNVEQNVEQNVKIKEYLKNLINNRRQTESSKAQSYKIIEKEQKAPKEELQTVDIDEYGHVDVSNIKEELKAQIDTLKGRKLRRMNAIIHRP